MNKIGTGFIHKLNKLVNKNNETAIHVDDEIPNMFSKENRFKKFFRDLLKKLDNKTFDQSYSIGICLGNFFYNWVAFWKAPMKEKILNISTLALAIGLPAIKLIPQMKKYIKNKIIHFGKL